jgi:hypothetical protein
MKVGICNKRAVGVPIRSFIFLNYITDLREADYDYIVNVDRISIVLHLVKSI